MPSHATGTDARVVLYLHGGAFALMRPHSLTDLMIRYALGVDAHVLCVDYRRPPSHKHPVAVDDCLASYMWLLDQVCGVGINGCEFIWLGSFSP